MADQPKNIGEGVEAFKSFMIDSISIKDKSSPEYGKAISEYISSTVYSGQGGYYFDRNARFARNRAWANGKIDIRGMFGDRFNYDGKTNYINLFWDAIQVMNRIISGLVGRWMGRNEKISIQAKDSYSENQKIEQYQELEFWIEQREKIEALQKESGVQIMPQDIPDDKDELLLFKQFNKLPEEVLAELGVNGILEANGDFDGLKQKHLMDLATTGMYCKYVWMDKEGVVHPDYVKPENSIYSYSEYDDFRDTSWRGQAPSMKISEIRKKYGLEFGGKLTEKELWEIAKTGKNYQKTDNITFLDTWINTYMRPYDEVNVDSIQFELRTVDSEKYTVTTTKATGRTILAEGPPKTKSGNIKEKPSDNQEVFDDSNINIYRGVYLPQSKTLLEWGLKKNMIRPQDPKEIGNAEFSYSFYMYQNYKMRNIAVPEKIEQPVKGMVLSLLKIEQVVAKAKPPGAMINWRGLQNMDFGLGDKKNKEIDIKKLYEQTGDLYYYDLDENDKPIGIPITEIPNTGFAPAMEAWVRTYQFHYQTLKDQLGEDPNFMAQAIQPRVTSQNVDASQRSAEYSTDYIYDAFLYGTEDTANKALCLMQKSIQFGAKVYRHLMSESPQQDRIFNASAKMLPTDQEIAVLDAQMQNAIASTPDLAMYLNTFKVLQIAKENIKLAEQYYHNCMKKMLQSKIQQAADNQDKIIKGQQDSAVLTEKEKRKSLNIELNIKKKISDSETNNAMKKEIVAGIFQIYAKGLPIPTELKGLETEVIRNVGLPLFAENVANADAIVNGMQDEQEPQDNGMEEQQEVNNQPQQQEVAA